MPLSGVCGLLIWWGPFLFRGNFAVAIPGQVYRSAQPAPATLAGWVENLGIRTVINLRGENPAGSWYRAERQVSAAAGLRMYDVPLRSGGLPGAQHVRSLIRIFDEAERPVLIHCQNGADRTALAAAVWHLLTPGETPEQARAEFALRRGYFGCGRTAELRQFLDLYAAWIREQRTAHSPAFFRRWVAEIYAPYGYKAELRAAGFPSRARAGRPFDTPVQVTNRSSTPWVFRSDPNRGIHLGIRLERLGSAEHHTARGRGIDRVVPPGGSWTLIARIDVPASPGRYRATFDLVDEKAFWFAELGSEPLIVEFEVVGDGLGQTRRPIR